jgi:pimeloyl-ACP methyl ester carboxylesterase
MLPTYFGLTHEPLFGVYHASETPRPRHAVLICQSLGHEYARAQRTCRQLAVSLARAGHPTLRFDYFGSGDSAGRREDATVERWREDIVVAAQELLDYSACQRMSVIGLRLGASLAATVPEYPIPLDTLVLWDPVTDGHAFVNDLTLMHRSAIEGDRRLDHEGDRGLLGYPLSEEFRRQIEDISLMGGLGPERERTIIAASSDRPAYRALNKHLSALGAASEHHLSGESGNWDHAPSRVSVFSAPETIRLLTNLLTT